MMHGLVLDETAPLYGRATEIIKVTPMLPAALRDALQLDPEQSAVAYSVWGRQTVLEQAEVLSAGWALEG